MSHMVDQVRQLEGMGVKVANLRGRDISEAERDGARS